MFLVDNPKTLVNRNLSLKKMCVKVLKLPLWNFIFNVVHQTTEIKTKQLECYILQM